MHESFSPLDISAYSLNPFVRDDWYEYDLEGNDVLMLSVIGHQTNIECIHHY
jgi:hypothetical protein